MDCVRRTTDRTLLIWAVCLLASHLVVTALIVLSKGVLNPGAPFAGVGIWFATNVLGFTDLSADA
jgi:hypothetical protein